MAGHATQDEQVREHVDDVDRLELAGDPDRQAFVGELVDDVEHPELAPVMRAVLDEVIGPDVVAVLRPKTDTGAVVVSQSRPLLGCLAGTFSPSRRQMRSTRLSFTNQPAARSRRA